MNLNDDILATLEDEEQQKNEALSFEFSQALYSSSEENETSISSDIFEEIQEHIVFENQKEEVLLIEKKYISKGFRTFIFSIKYICTSATIFALLLLISNYSAYWNITKSFLYAGELEQTKNSLIQSVAAANVSDESEDISEMNTFRQLGTSKNTTHESLDQKHSLSAFVAKNDTTAMNIEITPYENRIVIPKIGKNIPLIDIQQTSIAETDELNDIFMDELQNGVVRYPGSAKPGDDGNAFIFGHSSNFPWMKGDYNNVFALLDKVVFDDEIIVYYGQEKFTYKIRSKNVIRPGDVSVLKSHPEKGTKEITLMTCWPVGTTLNRLVLTGDLVATK